MVRKNQITSLAVDVIVNEIMKMDLLLLQDILLQSDLKKRKKNTLVVMGLILFK